MKKFLLVVSAVSLLSLGVTSSAAPSDMKIGVLDLNKVMMDSQQLKDAKAKLESEFGAREKKMAADQKAFQSDIETFSKNSPTMKPEDKKAAQAKIVEKQKKLQEEQTKFQNDLNNTQNSVLKDITKKIENIVNGIATEKKYDLVIAKAAAAYNKAELEITNEVIQRLKKK